MLVALFSGGGAAQDLVVSESVAGARFRFAAEDDATLAARLTGRTLTIAVDRPIAPPDLEATADAAAFVGSARIGESGRALVLDLQGDYSIDARRVGGAIIVDLLADPTVGAGQIVIGPAAPSTPAPQAQPSTRAPTPQARAVAPPQPPAARVRPTPSSSNRAAADFVGSGEAVGLRFGEHKDRTRIVFDWPAPVAFATYSEGARVAIRFARTGRLDLRSAKAYQARRAIEFAPRPDAQGLLVGVGGPDGARIKVFALDRRVVVDVFSPAGVKRSVDVIPPPRRAAAASAPNDRRSGPEGPPVAWPTTQTLDGLPDGLYVAGRVGGALSALADVDPRFGGVTRDDRPDALGFLASAEVGVETHRLGAPVRLGVELATSNFNIFNIDESGGSQTASTEIDVNSLSAAAVVGVDFAGDLAPPADLGPVTPFVVGGLGLAAHFADVTDSADAPFDDMSVNLAWMVGAGAAIALDDQLALDARYAFRHRGDVADSSAGGSAPRLRSHEFTVGARYAF